MEKNDKNDLVELEPADQTLKVLEYDSDSRTAKVALTPGFRVTQNGKKIRVERLTLSPQNIYAICPDANRNGKIKAGKEFVYDTALARGLVVYHDKKSSGYEIRIKEVNDDGKIDTLVVPGKRIKDQKGVIKSGRMRLNENQLRDLNPLFEQDKTPKRGLRFVVDRDKFEKFYNDAKQKSIKPAAGSPAENVDIDNEINPENLELPDPTSGSGLESLVVEGEENDK